MATNPSSLKVAAVARRTGLSVRTLHYYEEIGLVSPSGRTPSGHRLYSMADVQMLQLIRSLRQLGMGLAEIGTLFRDGSFDAQRIVSDHLARVREQLRSLARLETQLEELAAALAADESDDELTTERLLTTLESITMMDKYFTQQQLERLKEHQASGTETVSPVVEALQQAMESGVAPDSSEAEVLVQRWNEAIDEVTQGDEEMARAIHELLHNEQQARVDHGISDELFAYMGKITGGAEHD